MFFKPPLDVCSYCIYLKASEEGGECPRACLLQSVFTELFNPPPFSKGKTKKSASSTVFCADETTSTRSDCCCQQTRPPSPPSVFFSLDPKNKRVFVFPPPQLFVGLSFPYEGPAPLEAIANGCAFLNPKFNPPKSSKNTDFFKGKPTLREVRHPPGGGRRFLARFLTSLLSPQLTSQHPYAEVYVGQPHVWTVDIENSAEVERAIRSILSQKVTEKRLADRCFTRSSPAL